MTNKIFLFLICFTFLSSNIAYCDSTKLILSENTSAKKPPISDYPVGFIMIWDAVSATPRSPVINSNKWLLCDGSIISEDKYPELYNILRSRNGRLPNFNSAYMRGYGKVSGESSIGAHYESGELGELQSQSSWLPEGSKLFHSGGFREVHYTNWDKFQYSNERSEGAIQVFFADKDQAEFPNGFQPKKFNSADMVYKAEQYQNRLKKSRTTKFYIRALP